MGEQHDSSLFNAPSLLYSVEASQRTSMASRPVVNCAIEGRCYVLYSMEHIKGSAREEPRVELQCHGTLQAELFREASILPAYRARPP